MVVDVNTLKNTIKENLGEYCLYDSDYNAIINLIMPIINEVPCINIVDIKQNLTEQIFNRIHDFVDEYGADQFLHGLITDFKNDIMDDIAVGWM